MIRLKDLNRLLPPGHLALLLLALMLSLPFLDPHHHNPIPSFYAEWWAALFGLAAGLCLLLPRPPAALQLPKIALLPALLAALILIQLAFHPAARGEMSLLAVLYLLWVIYLMGLGKTLAAVHGQAPLADTLAGGILLGALLSALIVAAQWSGLKVSIDWVSPPAGDRLFANLNQPNHLALQLWIGVAALIHLQTRQRVGAPLAAAATVLLVAAALLSGSRALWLYAGGLVLWAILLRRKMPAARSWLPGALWALVATAIGKLTLPTLTGQAGPVSWVQPASDGIRGGLWWMASRMGIENPWLGIGWGHFSSATYGRIEDFRRLAPASLQLVPGEHAHNFALNLFAELGVLAPLLLLVLLVLWLRRVGRHEMTPPAAFALAVLLLLGIHAQLEYTLWYAYFLGIAALALALADPGHVTLPPLRRSLLGLVLVAAIATLLLLRHDYERLEQAMSGRPRGDDAANASRPSAIEQLVDLRRRSQFGRYVDLAMVGAMPLNREALPDKLVLCEHAIAFSPTDYTVFKCAALHALNGQAELAMTQWTRALASYPRRADEVTAELSALIGDHPELAPLLAAARLSAVRPGQ